MRAKLLVHGGASNLQDFPPILKEKLEATQQSCAAIPLNQSALDMVEQAAAALEDKAALNAGYGSVLQMDGRIRMDAAICTDERRYAGIMQIENVRNPIKVARCLMDYGYHSILSGDGAQAFAREEGFAHISNTTDHALEDYQKSRKDFPKLSYSAIAQNTDEINVRKLSTIGAVAIDAEGRLAASCSTGGTKFCYPGRVGDTPIYGAGLYCNEHIAIACTGEGEKVLRRLSAKRAEEEFLKHGNLQKALDDVVADLFAHEKGYLGIIAITKDGESGYAYNTGFMAYAEKT